MNPTFSQTFGLKLACCYYSLSSQKWKSFHLSKCLQILNLIRLHRHWASYYFYYYYHLSLYCCFLLFHLPHAVIFSDHKFFAMSSHSLSSSFLAISLPLSISVSFMSPPLLLIPVLTLHLGLWRSLTTEPSPIEWARPGLTDLFDMNTDDHSIQTVLTIVSVSTLVFLSVLFWECVLFTQFYLFKLTGEYVSCRRTGKCGGKKRKRWRNVWNAEGKFDCLCLLFFPQPSYTQQWSVSFNNYEGKQQLQDSATLLAKKSTDEM